MEKGICHISVAPIRREPSDPSEIISQILFGESLTVLSKSDQWVKVKLDYDGYEGWMDEKQFLPTTVAFLESTADNTSVSIEIVQGAIGKKITTPLLLGSSLPNFDGMSFKLNQQKVLYNGQAVLPGSFTLSKGAMVEKMAHRYLNAPYLWGGRSPFGIDCSGFTQMLFKILGIRIKRDAYQQAEQGTTVDFVQEARTGDLAFFENGEGKIAHVGIVLDNQMIAHAYGKVRKDTLDHYGIYNNDKKAYSHRLRLIKRYF